MSAIAARRLEEIDWSIWTPEDLATLTFVFRSRDVAEDVAEDEVLLIRKKRGLGAGKINGPGGRLEGDESFLECAVREVEEELRITPRDVAKSGELRFQFVDGYSLHVHVFRAESHEGRPEETDEAIPLWTPIDAVPYDEMWADDRLWLPHLFARRPFSGRFLFDDDDMLDHALECGNLSKAE